MVSWIYWITSWVLHEKINTLFLRIPNPKEDFGIKIKRHILEKCWKNIVNKLPLGEKWFKVSHIQISTFLLTNKLFSGEIKTGLI